MQILRCAQDDRLHRSIISPHRPPDNAGMTISMTANNSALAGIRVIDMSRVFAAPVGAQILGDLGADVIKVERPGVGDDGRGYGFSSVPGKDGIETRHSSFFTVSNRNKRSITLNHAKPEGQEILRKLVETADVLIENYKVGDLKRFGLDYESLKAINPRLIYCSVTGFGQTGPMAALPGYDGLFQATANPAPDR
jgi:crotonobetainyl-CoA:carnitine CoA-transferase CaiB-like acyl-CoA transferase